MECYEKQSIFTSYFTTQYDIRITQYEIQSIKNNKLCETKPIFQKVKCL
jgi:hypothetical protein